MLNTNTTAYGGDMAHTICSTAQVEAGRINALGDLSVETRAALITALVRQQNDVTPDRVWSLATGRVRNVDEIPVWPRGFSTPTVFVDYDDLDSAPLYVDLEFNYGDTNYRLRLTEKYEPEWYVGDDAEQNESFTENCEERFHGAERYATTVLDRVRSIVDGLEYSALDCVRDRVIELACADPTQ